MYSQKHLYITYLAPHLRAPQELSLEAAIRHLQGIEPPLVIEHNGDFAAGGHYDAWVRKRNDKSRMCLHVYAHAARLAEAAAPPTPPPQQAPQQQAAKRTRMKSKRRSKSPGAGNHEKNKEPQKHCRRRGR
jgi:hypothetical protein